MSDSRKLQPVLNALPAFEEAARASSFSTAAQVLGMAQPSVSRFIANLENQIGVKLFVRQHNHVTLTVQGERLYEATALGLGHIRSVLGELSTTAPSETITISCTHGFAHMWILPRMDRLKVLLGNQDVTIVTTDHTNSASQDDNQLVVRFGDGTWRDGTPLLLFMEDVFPVCSPEFASRYNLLDGNLTPEEFSSLPLIVQDDGDVGWMNWPKWFACFDVAFERPSDIHAINNYAFVLQSAMEGKGIALAWHNLIEPYLSNGWLTRLTDFAVTTNSGYYLMCPHNHAGEPVVRRWITDTA